MEELNDFLALYLSKAVIILSFFSENTDGGVDDHDYTLVLQ